MTEVILEASDKTAIPVHAAIEGELAGLLDAAPAFVKGFAALSEFKAKSGQVLVVPGPDGSIDQVLFGLGSAEALDAMAFRALPAKLPAGDYRIATAPAAIAFDQIALAFALGSYRFDRYKPRAAERPRLVAEGVDVAEVRHVAHACALARDMVNTPANDLGPVSYTHLTLPTICSV